VTVLVRWIAVPAVVETWNPHEAHPRSPRRRQRPGLGVSATRAARAAEAVRRAMSRDTRPDTPRRPRRRQSAAGVAKHRCNSIGVLGKLGRGADRHHIPRWPETTGWAHPGTYAQGLLSRCGRLSPALSSDRGSLSVAQPSLPTLGRCPARGERSGTLAAVKAHREFPGVDSWAASARHAFKSAGARTSRGLLTRCGRLGLRGAADRCPATESKRKRASEGTDRRARTRVRSASRDAVPRGRPAGLAAVPRATAQLRTNR